MNTEFLPRQPEQYTVLQQERNLNFYNISTDSLLRLHGPEGLDKITGPERDLIFDKAADDLVKLVRDGTIWFPYQKYYRGDPGTLFANLKTIDLEVKEGPYKLHSYYPLYGSYLPPKFRGVPTMIAGMRGTYDLADVLSDHFIEDIRLKAKRYDQIRSILECWEIDLCLKEIMKTVLKKKQVTPATLRDAIYETTPETKIFNPTWAKTLLKLVMGNNLAGKKWLDISAGWGDRLLTAMSLNMEYTGFDPNIELQPGHSAMIERFGHPNIHRVIYEPFEKAEIPGGPYDVVLSSPPYFTIEEYAPGQQGQSIVSYPDFDQWMVWFLFNALDKAWNNLKEGGYLILHLGDAKTIATAEAANIFIDNYLPGASWEGVIGLKGDAGYPRPVWVWKKVARNERKNVWEPHTDRPFNTQRGAAPFPSSKRTLYNTYPSLQAELIRYYAIKYAPYYSIRRSSASAVRSHISVRLPDIPKSAIEDTLKDDLLISSLLEVIGADETVDLLTKLMSQYPNLDMNNIYAQVNPITPYFLIRKSNADNIRAHVSVRLPTVKRDLINNILQDDLMISSLIETLDAEQTIVWAVAMLKLALHV